jgi:hypothetical protein
MIIQVLIAQTDPIDPLPQQAQLAVLNISRVSRIGDDTFNRLELTESPVDLTQQ